MMDPGPPSPPLDALVARARNGDEEACDGLVREVYPVVERCIRRQIRVRADHDDVRQEVFMKLFLKIDQYHGPQPFEHWVSRIAVTTCYDWLRKQQVRPSTPMADLSEEESAALARALSGGLDGDLEIRRELLSGLLEKLIDGLKPREQVVIRMLDLEERGVKEVAEITGWSVSKVKMTALRGRKKLSERLKFLEGGGPRHRKPYD